MDNRPDCALVVASRRGDASAFTALMRRHWPSVYAVAYAELLRREDAEDAAQETFLRAYTCLSQLRAGEAFRSWICRIAWSQARGHLRRTRREVIMDVSETMRDAIAVAPDQERFERDDDAKRLVAEGLAAMSVDLRLPLVLRHMTGHSYAAIPERLAISEAGARSRVRPARESFAAHLCRVGREGDCRAILRERLSVAPISVGFRPSGRDVELASVA